MGRRGLIVIVVALLAAGGLTIYQKTKPGPHTPEDVCAVWKPGIAAILRTYPHTTTTLMTEEEMERVYPFPSDRPQPDGPLAYLPEDEAAQPQVEALLDEMKGVMPPDMKDNFARYRRFRDALEAAQDPDPTSNPTTLTGMGIVNNGLAKSRVDRFLLEHCGRP